MYSQIQILNSSNSPLSDIHGLQYESKKSFLFDLLQAFQAAWSEFTVFKSRENPMQSESILTLDAGWIAPTPADIAEFKMFTGWSTGELARVADISPKHLRNFFKEDFYIRRGENGRISYSVWRFWLENFGFVEPKKLEPLKPFIRAAIFTSDSKEWVKPNISEFRTLAVRSGSADSTIARFLNQPEPLIKHLLHSPDKGPEPFHIQHADWISFLNRIRMRTLADYMAPPIMPDSTLLPVGEGYEPPNPKIVRQFIAWTGRRPEELSAIFGIDASKLTFFASNRSARTTDASIPSTVFSADGWRAPTFRELRTFMNVYSLDPMETAKKLRLSPREMKIALITRDNTSEKEAPLDIEQSDWFSLLDVLKIFDMAQLDKLTERESRAYHINYSVWRLMLTAFGIVEPLNFQRKM
ncbi:TPA: hypothetical protein QDZ84_003465 [Shewanella algae]|uniref:hypothetical protein n=1 Tax=Shewanella TaxID=22 RepID=UPI00142FBCA1|nr:MULTISPECIES: hypothetical protein [Shewanella]NJI86931.1 hypothetical protein [Shewanella sp. Iso12]HDS1208426.1 hypothetical protein [Shewanella algae]